MAVVAIRRTIIVPNDTDPDDGTFGRSYRWTTTTGPYTPRTKKNGADPEQGRFFNEGEITMGMYAVYPYSGSGPLRYMGRHFNFHDEPVSGYVWGDVSPAAVDVQRADYGGHDPGSGAREFTLEYTSSCPGAGGVTHFNEPILDDEWNYVFYEIQWETTCTGYVKVWVVNSARDETLGPAINLSNVITLHGAPYFPGVWVWLGGYINTGYFSGGAATIDHSLDFWGYSWGEAWADEPVIVDEWGSNLSSSSTVATVDSADFRVPDEIVAMISGGAGGGGVDPGPDPGGGGTIPDVPSPYEPGFCDSPRWRYLLTDLSGNKITVLDKQARNRSIEFGLNQPTVGRGEISSDNPQANITYTDGFPYLTEGNRLVYAFRRDYNGIPSGTEPPWICRAAGTVLGVDDSGNVDNANTVFTFYDPWQILFALPVVNPADTTGRTPVSYNAPIDEIIIDLLENAEFYYTFANPYKTGIDLFGGTVESLPALEITFQQETSIGQCLQQLCAAGCDIVLEPAYDPANPGKLCNLNVYAEAGVIRSDAVFGWDKGPRSIVQDTRQIDGTQRANKIRFHLQADGTNTEAVETVTNYASVSRFGEYWQTQYYPAASQQTIEEYAATLMPIIGEGRRTVTIGVTPERSPCPFLEWYLGDYVPVFASKRLRATQSGYQRVLGFTVEISDNALESIRDLRVYIPGNEGT